MNEIIDGNLVRKLFIYEEGNLYWSSSSKYSSVSEGKLAGSVTKGYRIIIINHKKYMAHRLVYLYHYDELPLHPLMLDHINGNKLDNRIENLRVVSNQQNQWNRSVSKKRDFQYKNVYFMKKKNKYKVEFTFNGKSKYIGLYESLEVAVEVARKYRAIYHQEYAKNS